MSPIDLKKASRVACPGCGANNLEPDAQLCPVCRKGISEGFQPLDAIRSSYHLQGRRLASVPDGASVLLFRTKSNGLADAAWACTVYSMVPYLGILFVPFAIGIGIVSYIAKRNTDEGAGARKSLAAIGVSVMILIVQLVLWWLLYLIPKIGL